MKADKYKFKDQISGNGPRERMIEHGPDTLTNAELLATIFVTGNRDENVMELCTRVFKEYGSRSITNIRDVSKVIEVLGLGPAKAAQLVAIFEIGRRFFQEENGILPTIRDPRDVFELTKHMQDLRKEEMRAFYLNSRQKVVREELISLGTENVNIVTPKEIIYPAVELMARGIIIAHNHPSADPSPSQADIEFTQKLRTACDIMGVELLDHVIVASKGYNSFRDLGLF